MYNSTTIGAGLGGSPSRLLAWGLGWSGIAKAAWIIYSTIVTIKNYIESKITVREY